MDNNLEQAKRKADACQADLTTELDSYTLSRFRPSASRLSDRLLATNRKAFHRKKMRQIVNECFNKEEEEDEPTMPLSQQAAFPSQPLALTLAEYRNSRYYRELLQKTEECKAALIDVLETYIKSCFPSSPTGRSTHYFAKLQSFHREQMLLLIDDYFNSEEDDLPTFSTTVHSGNQLNVTSIQEYAQVDTTPAMQSDQEVASYQVDTTPAIQSISPFTPSDQQNLVNSGEAQVKEKPIEEASSTQSREVDAPNTIENIVIVSITEQEQSDCEADSDCGCDDCMANKGRAQANPVMIFLDCNNSDVLPSDTIEELPTAGNVSGMTNNLEINEANNSLPNQVLVQDKDQMEESVVQMQTNTQQQKATVEIAVNANAEQVDNSVNNNFENLMDLVMDFSDYVAVNEQVDAEPIIDDAFVDEAFPPVDLVSLPSTSTGRRLTRSIGTSKKVINFAEPDEDSADEYSTVNRNGKRTIPHAGVLSTSKRVAVEPVVAADDHQQQHQPDAVEEEDYENEDEELDVEAEVVRFSVIVHHLNCPEAGCTEEFPDKAQLNGHLLSKHQINEFRCKIKDCALSFATQNELSDHRKWAHRNLKNLPCAKCEIICKSYSELSTHFVRYHEEGEFHCSADKCDFNGKTRIKVYNHQYEHRPAKYECTFVNCKVSFKQKSALTTHQRIHTQERPFACEECNQAFTRKEGLTRHQRIHSGLKPYRCTWQGCDYSVRHRSTVYIHVRTVHFGLPATKKAQDEQNIIDTRDAGEFIEKNPTK